MRDEKKCNAWAWWDNERQEFRHVYPKRLCVQACFPDGGKNKIEQGLGEIMEVVITAKEKR